MRATRRALHERGRAGGSRLAPRARAIALVAFNLGVELGQLAIVAAFLPLALAQRRSALYPRFALAGG